MLKIDLPPRGAIELHHAVFDFYGTLAIDGVLIPELSERLRDLKEMVTVHILTANNIPKQAELERTLGIPIHITHRAEEKLRYVQELKGGKVVAIGNGNNDIGMLRLAAIGIAVIGPEGLSARALQAADILVNSPFDAIDLLLQPQRLTATLRE